MSGLCTKRGWATEPIIINIKEVFKKKMLLYEARVRAPSYLKMNADLFKHKM
jgi:hypothetical protein